jgi:hypothetical protein
VTMARVRASADDGGTGADRDGGGRLDIRVSWSSGNMLGL